MLSSAEHAHSRVGVDLMYCLLLHPLFVGVLYLVLVLLYCT